jgi:hypothetical protein
MLGKIEKDLRKMTEEVAMLESALWHVGFQLDSMEEVRHFVCTTFKHPFNPINNQHNTCYCGHWKYTTNASGKLVKVKAKRGIK